jgi:hypothetical protein
MTSCKKADERESVVHEICADECSDDEVMIPEVDKHNKMRTQIM